MLTALRLILLPVGASMSLALFAATPNTPTPMREAADHSDIEGTNTVCISRKTLKSLTAVTWQELVRQRGRDCTLTESSGVSYGYERWSAECTEQADVSKKYNYRIDVRISGNQLMIDGLIDTVAYQIHAALFPELHIAQFQQIVRSFPH